MPFIKALSDDAMIVHAFGLVPERAGPIIAFTEKLMRGPSPLSVAERELIGAYVSGVNSCRYCFGAHAATAQRFGVDPALFDGLMTDVDGATVDDRLKPILKYVKKLTETPHRMVQADADAVFAAGWDERALIDAVNVCALFNYFNRLVEGLGLAANRAQAETSGDRLHEHGYFSVLKMLGLKPD